MTRTLKLGLIAGAAVAAVALPAAVTMRNSDRAITSLPVAALVEPVRANREVAVLAGGCFWGVEAVFEHVKGVVDVRSGYAGRAGQVNYGNVTNSGSAEAVRIIFDPRLVNYSALLRIHFAVAHDPTQVNRQGPDVGPQYRSAIFPQSAGQARVARAYLAQLAKARVFKKPVATRIEQGRFVEAEAYHQDFMARNPRHPYILIHDRPKLAALKRQFPASWKG